jgi:flagellar assembly factor FliW
MLIDTARFGKVEIDESKIIYFSDGIPGLEEYKRFAILQFDGSYPIIWLQSTEDKSICLPVIDSFLVLPDYSFDISDEDVQRLSLNGPEDLKIISVLVIPENIERMTMNLAAPIVINIKNNLAMQVILNNGEYNVRFPIFQEVMRLVKEDNADAGTV